MIPKPPTASMIKQQAEAWGFSQETTKKLAELQQKLDEAGLKTARVLVLPHGEFQVRFHASEAEVTRRLVKEVGL